MERAGSCDTLLEKFTQVDWRCINDPVGGTDSSRSQDLFDGRQQPVAVLEHDAIKLGAFLLLNGTT
jgi:hypothetical protein